MQIPPNDQGPLGLTSERSSSITTELNRFIWPGPDIRALPSGEYSLGYVPAKLFEAVIRHVRTPASKKQQQLFDRDEK